jgi:uncharacterized protein (TIGR03437 family)
MRLVRFVAFGILVVASSVRGQSILNRFSVPYNYTNSAPFIETAQFNAPDSSGGLILFNLGDNSLRRFDSTGKQRWTTTFTFGPNVGGGVVTTMAVAQDGILLGGQLTGTMPGQTSAGGYDSFVSKYDFNGNNLWNTQFGTASGDFTRTIVLDPDGFYVLGVTDGPNRIFIRSSDPNGNEIWTRHFNDPSVTDIFGGAADPTGIYFFGQESDAYNLVRKFDSKGNDLWSHSFDHAAVVTSVAADGKGVYIAYLDSAPANYVTRLDATGTEVWTRQMTIDSAVYASVVTDGTGFYLFGAVAGALPGQCYAGDADIFVMRFDSEANPIWTREFGTAGFERPAQVSITNSTVYVSGFGPLNNNVFLTTLAQSPSPTAGAQPTILNECVLSAANFLGGGVAPGEIVTILGSGLGPADPVSLRPSSGGQIATNLGGTQILFNGEPAPMIYASDGQSSAVVPYDLAGQTTVSVQVQYNGASSTQVTLPVLDTRLGVFSLGTNGTGQAAVINQDGTVNSASNPAAANSFVSIYATGGGLPSPLGATNQITGTGASTFKGSAYVRLYSDGSCDSTYFPATVTYYGGAPEAVPGLIQINAQLPGDVPTGDAVPLYIGLDTTGTVEQMVTIAVK